MKTVYHIKWFFVGFLLLILLTGCAAAETPTAEPTATPEPTQERTPVPTAILTSIPVDTPAPVTLSWIKKADMSTPRFGFSSIVVDGKIYVMGGGTTGIGEPLTKVEMYDPATDSWTTKADMLTGRKWFSTSVVAGKIYAIGGSSGPEWFSPSVAAVEMYDPETDTWTAKADLPVARDSLAAVVLDGKIYAIGGLETATPGDYGSTVTHVEIYDPVTDTWQAGQSMRIAKETRAVVIDGKIYATDGSTTEVYDPTEESWSLLPCSQKVVYMFRLYANLEAEWSHLGG
jgi:N-acetylneuraminic acid mutarotase